MHSHTSFDELLELSHQGNNRVIDMLVGDIYGTDYSKVCLSSFIYLAHVRKFIKHHFLS